ncbi:LysM peptidoglycan-binding domain-containing protein [Flavobacterium sp. GA093]|uniref:LysM peptidoglycan-binding domain-containing protein n=1 Tax=Flavobacterium hydrocarbonoxydans TaxID=2683249 RepID=A0A6I4NLL2_9FLAO|nr:peptidoglycan endopeptidase [Flavobacterium hydrocarbonoxydans]MWB95051.1 LysM peptidoglycan-binding domain-containing protein [Flavobacterium hydrocarbonoxydans]
MIFRLIVVLFFFSISAFSQDNFIKHTVSKGDNIYAIAKQYGVKPKAIIEANPNAPKILKLNSVLLIPNNNAVVAKPAVVQEINAVNPSVHTIVAKETLWGISKKYNVSVDDLKKSNPILVSDGLKIGQQINIPSIAVEVVAENVNTESAPIPQVEVVREVLPKETKFAIAKEFGITVAELEKQNPGIKKKLPLGYQLKILTSPEKAAAFQTAKPIAAVTENPEKIVTETTNDSVVKKDSTVFVFTSTPELIDQLVFKATDNIGVRYRSGGTTNAGFDCSGLMCSTFGNFDIKLPRTSHEQSRVGLKVEPEQAQKGDLIFFKTNGRRQINHVGMVVEVLEGEIKFVHASTHGGVMISSTKEPYYQRNFSQVNRILQQ